MKILYVANIHRHFNAFHKPYIKMLQDMGYEVHLAANGDDIVEEADIQYQIDIQRSPYDFRNIKAYFQLKKIIDTEQYQIVHCHTPMGGILGRLASSKSRKKGTKILYTAHGFHFCKGGPVKNWILYYPIEKIMAKHTDVIITINKEDFEVARKFKISKHYSIPGIGLDIDGFKKIPDFFDRNEKRKSFGIQKDELLLMSTGDLTTRKNHKVVIEAMSKIPESNIKYIICGVGDQLLNLKKLSIKLGVAERVIFLGHRSDILELLKASDIFIFPSLWEGLGIAGIEAMAAGIPVIASNRHGIKDYAIDGSTAILCDPLRPNEFSTAIQRIFVNQDLQSKLVTNGDHIINKFNISEAITKMREIYEEVLL